MYTAEIEETLPTRLYRVPEIAPYLRVGKDTVYHWLLANDLPRVFFGTNCIRLAMADLYYLLAESGMVEGYTDYEIQETLGNIQDDLAVAVPLKDHYTAADLSQLLGISLSFISLLKNRGALAFIRIGGRFYFRAEAINACVEAHHLHSDVLQGYNWEDNPVHLNNSIGRAAAYSQPLTNF